LTAIKVASRKALRTRNVTARRRAHSEDPATAQTTMDIRLRHPPLEALATQLQAACRPAMLRTPAARALAALARERSVAAASSPFGPAARVDALWLVSQGCVTVGHLDGRHWRATRTVHAGEWLDAASAWLDLPLAEQAVAETDSVLVGFPIAEVEVLCTAHPPLARVLLTLLAQRVRQLTESTHGLLSKDVLARCASWLVEAARIAGDGATVLLAQRKRSIASQIGATPETFSRTLRQLREMGAIDVEGYRIRVRDGEALERLAGVGVTHHHVAIP
jgi:CRP-like cAMP-binding protein